MEEEELGKNRNKTMKKVHCVLRGRVAEGAHQRHEQRWRSGLSQERVVQQFEGGGSLSRVSHQHSIQEPLQPC